MQFDKSSSSTTAASFSLSLSHNGRVCHRSFFLFFLVYLPVWLLLCYYTKDVVCLSIKDINLLIRETGQTTMMYVYANARRWEGAEKGGTMTRQQRTVLFKCENLKMRERGREGRVMCSPFLSVCVCVLSFFLFFDSVVRLYTGMYTENYYYCLWLICDDVAWLSSIENR
jgi:hypothetical protein